MVNVRPPERLPGSPTKVTLAAGTELVRVHSARRSATAFNSNPADCFYGGGRFDGTELDDYGFLYAGLTVEAAVCETLLRSIPFDPAAGPRLLQRAAVQGRRLSFLRLATDVTVLSLVSGRDLASVAQDAWLVQAEAAEYPFTRAWGHWIRAHTDPWAQGFVWPSKREPADRAMVLFLDRCPAFAVEPCDVPPVDLDTAEGLRRLNAVLAPYHARVAP